MSGAAERADAARLLHGVVVGRRTADQVMAGTPPSPLTRELLLGSLRHFYSLERAVTAALHRPMKARDEDIRLLMIVGAHQLRHLRIPDHAAINETVNACALLGKPWARGLVNAVLRRCAGAAEPACSEHPPWLEAALRSAYPADADAILAADNERAPMTLRSNRQRIAPADYLARLDAAGLESRAPREGDEVTTGGAVIRLGPETRVLTEPCPVSELPGYAEGLVSVQDAGAQFTPGILSPAPGERILDACAAPGGKLFHLLERCAGAHVMAVDESAPRLSQLHEQARRLGHERFTAVQGDATLLDWWDGVPYQRVLLDAPCTGTGTIRRHPDIKVLRRREDVAPLALLQRRLLDSLWRVLEPAGTLLYCTCSILPAENDEVIASFLASKRDALVNPFRLSTGRSTRYGWQLLPTNPDTDGFYFARLVRTGRGAG